MIGQTLILHPTAMNETVPVSHTKPRCTAQLHELEPPKKNLGLPVRYPRSGRSESTIRAGTTRTERKNKIDRPRRQHSYLKLQSLHSLDCSFRALRVRLCRS